MVGPFRQAQRFSKQNLHPFHIVQDIGVGHAQHAEAEFGQLVVAQAVFSFIMRVAIDLDDEVGGWAGEVGYVISDHILTTEFETFDLAVR